ncbi:MAG: 30S ribosomal protein S12 methylthiotransferase RimO [Candidatus Cloacimonadota bacterium]|nr:MAG: 30S ribosomal protein S12 methylthiotransferase RimO [Candidatus Cloacimonadota bacterium]
MKTFYIESLGCPKNLADSEIFKYLAIKANITPVSNPEKAELIIVNTCGFIESAKEEAVNTILEMAELKETGACKNLTATGCFVRRYMKNLIEEIPEVDHWIDLKDFKKFAELMNLKQEKFKRELMTPDYFAYIRISDGCNNRCSYCAIPGIRGKLDSVPLENLLEEAKYLADKGVKELIVTAQDTANYGYDINGKSQLPELLEKLNEIKGFEWIRVLYLHPAHLTEKIVDKMAELNKVIPYFDIPLQHINNDLLKSMNRHTNKEHILNILNYIRKTLPEAVIRTTFIVGYPGESFAKYKELRDFIKIAKFEKLGVFAYSPEEGTPAYEFPKQVSRKTAQKRCDELMSIQQEISENYLTGLIGKKIPVIIERKSESEDFSWEGRSIFDAPEIDGIVYVISGNYCIGDIVKLSVTDAWEYDLIAE